MVKKIEKKIVSYKVANNDSVEEKTTKATNNILWGQVTNSFHRFLSYDNDSSNRSRNHLKTIPT